MPRWRNWAAGRSVTLALTILLAAGTFAQVNNSLRTIEQALCDGDGIGVEQAVRRILADPHQPRTARFEALLLLAEVKYQGASMEHFLALTDSAAALLNNADLHDDEAWSRVETNRCRYAHFAMLPDRAIANGKAALDRYHRAKDKGDWKYAFQIYQALAAAGRNNTPAIQNRVFQYFDTAVALMNARTDVLPYWKATVWRSLSNAAMDHIRPQMEERAVYLPICLNAQRMAMRLLQEHYPDNHIDIAQLYNLHGLYHIYADQPDSALYWFRRTRELLRQDVFVGKDLQAVPEWLASLRWQAIVYDQSPWTGDAAKLHRFLQELVEAEPLFTRYTATEATAAGLFSRDPYRIAPFTAIVAVCQRLWALTDDERYLDQALRATEGVRRDTWNTAQRLRNRPDLVMPAPPERMLDALQAQLSNDEAVMICVDYDLALVSRRAFTLVVTKRGSTFHVADYTRLWEQAFWNSATAEPRTMLRAYHALYNDLYRPAEQLLSGHVKRLRILAHGQFTQIAFDALVADTSASSMRDCHPLVEKYAISHPFFILRPDHAAQVPAIGPVRYSAPVPGAGELTDLAVLRAAMVRWSTGILPGVLDSARTDASTHIKFLEGRGMLLLGGHCGGAALETDEPRHYWGASNEEANSMLPSDLLAMDIAPELVVHAACQSGAFRTGSGTGNVSFARAFLFAGTQQVIATVDVADERAAVQLLGFFLQELKDGQPADIALQRAKLAYLRQTSDPRTALPLYWAVWQQWGEAGNAPPERANRMALFTGLLALLIPGAVLLARRRRKRRKAA